MRNFYFERENSWFKREKFSHSFLIERKRAKFERKWTNLRELRKRNERYSIIERGNVKWLREFLKSSLFAFLEAFQETNFREIFLDDFKFFKIVKV